MIPKKIHFVWIGDSKGNLENICINSWREKLPKYEIIEWNESNFDIEREIKGNKFLEECYKRKLWAFISDFIRIKVLYEYGGVYLDTDMQIIRDITGLLDDNRLVCGFEDDGKYMSAGIICAEKGHPFLKDMLDYYENDVLMADIFTIPKIMTYILNDKYKQIDKNYFEEGICIYDKEYFYPFGFKEEFTYNCITENTYGIHWWSKSWAKKRNYFLESKHLTGFNKIWKCFKIFACNTLSRFKGRR